jgi:hypothetical protein
VSSKFVAPPSPSARIGANVPFEPESVKVRAPLPL